MRGGSATKFAGKSQNASFQAHSHGWWKPSVPHSSREGCKGKKRGARSGQCPNGMNTRSEDYLEAISQAAYTTRARLSLSHQVPSFLVLDVASWPIYSVPHLGDLQVWTLLGTA